MVFPSYLDQLSLSHQRAGKFLLDYWLHCHEPVISNGNLFPLEKRFLNRAKNIYNKHGDKVTNTNKLDCT